jgi:hypothetical protein
MLTSPVATPNFYNQQLLLLDHTSSTYPVKKRKEKKEIWRSNMRLRNSTPHAMNAVRYSPLPHHHHHHHHHPSPAP